MKLRPLFLAGLLAVSVLPTHILQAKTALPSLEAALENHAIAVFHADQSFSGEDSCASMFRHLDDISHISRWIQEIANEQPEARIYVSNYRDRVEAMRSALRDKWKAAGCQN
jgi:hypothetical protein